MNILEQEDIIKGLPDAALMKEASAPSGQVPQFLVVSEIKRRSDMRKRFEKEEQPQGTVKDQIVMEAMGIAPMMPSAMTPPQPPAAPMGAPSMGGMLPQGMPPMAPPQAPKPPMPMGGMPPMPMGGIASAPPAMPLIGMAQGGIVQMANGGSTSMPGAGALYGMQKEYVDPLLDRAKVLAQTAKISVEEAYELLVRQAQMNMPDYSMIAPAGMGEMPSLDVDLGMPTREQAQAADRAAVENIRSGLSPSITAGDIDSAVAGMVTERAPRSTIPELSTAPQRGAGGRPFDMGGISDLFSGITQGATNLATDLGIIGVDRDAKRRDRIAKNIEQGALVTPEMTAALDLADAQVDALDNVGVVRKEGVEDTPVGNAITELSNYPSLDESNPYLEQVQGTLDAARKITGDASVQGKSKIQTQPAPASKAPSDPDMPTLDFSDLIAEGKQQALANAMIQLGAGVASGDVAKGLSAAGTAAMKGTADARALDMKRRLAEYQAGREDIRRGDEAERFERQMTSKESQFDRQLAQLERKIDATIDVSNATTKRENLRALAGEVGSLREQVLTMTPAEKARFRVLESQLYQMLGIEMPDATVTAGLSGKDLSGLESLIGG